MVEVEDGKCQVLFADYGNTETVEIGNTRKMVDAFREIPLQAIQVVIDGKCTRFRSCNMQSLAYFYFSKALLGVGESGDNRR